MTSLLNIIRLALVVQCLAHKVAGCVLHPSPNGTDLFRVSEVKACLTTVTIDQDLMTQHIRMMKKLFEQNYAFYNTAADPLASTPSNHQPELGYTLYNTTRAGKVNLSRALAHLEEDVALHGANFTTFWALAKPFYQLYDGHITLPGTPSKGWYFGGLPKGGTNQIRVVPQKNHLLYANFFYQDGEMKLDMHFKDGVSKAVTKLNDQTPYDFIVSLANTPVEGVNLKALGSRVNALLTNFGGSGFPTVFQPFLLEVFTLADPEDILPESFTAEYGDGSNELFLTRVFATDDFLQEMKHLSEASLPANMSKVSQLMNQPGELYETWQQAVGKATSRRLQRTAAKTSTRALTSVSSCPQEYGGFTMLAWDCKDMQGVGYKIIEADRSEDSYAVVKIDTFANGMDIDILDMATGWMRVVNASKERGIKKLIVDISSNGGGTVDLGYALAQCMYPDVPYKSISNKYDLPFNEPMKIFSDKFLPWLEEHENDLLNGDLTRGAGSFSTKEMEEVLNVVEAITSFEDSIETEGFPRVQNLKNAADSLNNSFDATNLQKVISALVPLFMAHNPWTVADGSEGIPCWEYRNHFDDNWEMIPINGSCEWELDWGMKSPMELNKLPVKRYVRGGVEASFAPSYRMYQESKYKQVRDICSQQHFTEYLILGNGLSGSTANTFQTTVSQIAANAVSGSSPTLRGVTYGGTKDPFETPLTQFAGGSVNDGVQVSDQYVSLGSLYLVKILLQANEESTTRLEHILDDLVAAIPEPPYFLNAWPGMPFLEIYNNYMQPGAMPLEYVHMPPDFHIPQIFAKVSFADGEGGSDPLWLSDLYGRASGYFSSASSTTTTTTTGSLEVSSSVAIFPPAVSYVLMFLLCWLQPTLGQLSD
jgi:hypothetical protein